MRIRRVALLFALLLVLAASAGVVAQSAPAPSQVGVAQAPTSAKIWPGRHAEFEEFLRTASFQRLEDVPIGVTKPKRAYFEPGGLVASVSWKVLPPGRPNGYWESYKSEIAAYELDKLLQMDMVPPSVEKRWKYDVGAAIMWLKPVRQWKDVEKLEKPEHWNKQAVRMKMFDNLIGNIDRNQGNLLVDHDWNLFLIDHSRAFIDDGRKLTATMVRIDKALWERMRALDEPTLTTAIGKWVGRREIRAMLQRRDRMQVVIDGLLKKGSEAAVYIR